MVNIVSIFKPIKRCQEPTDNSNHLTFLKHYTCFQATKFQPLFFWCFWLARAKVDQWSSMNRNSTLAPAVPTKSAPPIYGQPLPNLYSNTNSISNYWNNSFTSICLKSNSTKSYWSKGEHSMSRLFWNDFEFEPSKDMSMCINIRKNQCFHFFYHFIWLSVIFFYRYVLLLNKINNWKKCNILDDHPRWRRPRERSENQAGDIPPPSARCYSFLGTQSVEMPPKFRKFALFWPAIQLVFV